MTTACNASVNKEYMVGVWIILNKIYSHRIKEIIRSNIWRDSIVLAKDTILLDLIVIIIERTSEYNKRSIVIHYDNRLVNNRSNSKVFISIIVAKDGSSIISKIREIYKKSLVFITIQPILGYPN